MLAVLDLNVEQNPAILAVTPELQKVRLNDAIPRPEARSENRVWC
jgi:hypothetical protein